MWSVVIESPEHGQHPGAVDVFQRLRVVRQVVEERRLLHVGRVRCPSRTGRLRAPAAPARSRRRRRRCAYVSRKTPASPPARCASASRRASARCRAGRPVCRRRRGPAARGSGRCPPCRPARTPPPAAATPGSCARTSGWMRPSKLRLPLSTAATTRSLLAAPRSRPAPAAGRCCRCRSCSHSRRCGSRSARGRAAARPLQVVGDGARARARGSS